MKILRKIITGIILFGIIGFIYYYFFESDPVSVTYVHRGSITINGDNIVVSRNFRTESILSEAENVKNSKGEYIKIVKYRTIFGTYWSKVIPE